MRKAHNKIEIDRIIKRKIRSMFFRQVEFNDIKEETGINGCVIRRIAKENNWYEKRERYLRFLCWYAYIHSISLYKIANMAKLKANTIARIHRKYNTPKPVKDTSWNMRIDEKIRESFIKDYNNGETAVKIAKKYGFKTAKTVLDVLEKKNVKRREAKKETFYDESFFEKINSNEKAYILGIMMTDGYIIKDYIGIGIQLTETDGYLLDEIANIIGADHGTINIKCDTKRRKMPNAKDMVRLTIHNRKMAEDIKNLGVVRNKSKIIRYNGCVPNKYMPSFFRGLIDGDGTVGIHSKNGNIWCQIASSSKEFIEDLINIDVGFKFSLNTSSIIYKNAISRMYVIRVSGGNKETIRFLRWIYKDKGTLYLRRKYEKMQDKII